MGVSTASHIDIFAESHSVACQHAEYAARILAGTEPARRPAMIEAAGARMRSYLMQQMPVGAPVEEILARAAAAFDEIINAGIKP
jgi:hypothetical protein